MTQVDIDGKQEIYGPIAINREQDQSFTLVPNPTAGSFKLKNTISTKAFTELKIFNTNGQNIRNETLLPKELGQKSIPFEVNSGMYFVKIYVDGEFNSTLKLVVK